jgi:hypothetical protein
MADFGICLIQFSPPGELVLVSQGTSGPVRAVRVSPGVRECVWRAGRTDGLRRLGSLEVQLRLVAAPSAGDSVVSARARASDSETRRDYLGGGGARAVRSPPTQS